MSQSVSLYFWQCWSNPFYIVIVLTCKLNLSHIVLRNHMCYGQKPYNAYLVDFKLSVSPRVKWPLYSLFSCVQCVNLIMSYIVFHMYEHWPLVKVCCSLGLLSFDGRSRQTSSLAFTFAVKFHIYFVAFAILHLHLNCKLFFHFCNLSWPHMWRNE